MTMTSARSDWIRSAPKTAAVPVLGAASMAAILGWGNVQSAHAGECSTGEASKVAVDRYGHKALSVSSHGDYPVVRLALSDGRVIDVAVDRWSC